MCVFIFSYLLLKNSTSYSLHKHKHHVPQTTVFHKLLFQPNNQPSPLQQWQLTHKLHRHKTNYKSTTQKRRLKHASVCTHKVIQGDNLSVCLLSQIISGTDFDWKSVVSIPYVCVQCKLLYNGSHVLVTSIPLP